MGVAEERVALEGVSTAVRKLIVRSRGQPPASPPPEVLPPAQTPAQSPPAPPGPA